MPDFQVNSAVPSSAIFTAGPIGDHILVRPIERSHMVGGMQIADTTVERPSEGVVLAVGHGSSLPARRGVARVSAGLIPSTVTHP